MGLPQYSSLTTHPDSGLRKSDSGGYGLGELKIGGGPGTWGKTLAMLADQTQSTVSGEKPEWEGRIRAKEPGLTIPVFGKWAH